MFKVGPIWLLMTACVYLCGPTTLWAEEDARAAWIAERIAQVKRGNVEKRQRAIAELVKGDKEGDCVAALTALLPESKKDGPLLAAIIRGLGRDGLERAALPIAALLTHKEALVRGNAAVSLEYIGSRDKKVISALKKFASKEKEPALANHGYRALGRCGSKEAAIGALLLKKAGGAKSEFASYGPCIGLAYFEGNKKAMRGVEKLLKKIGVPGSRRGGGTNVVKRGLVSWTLACIGDEKSAAFVRNDLIGGLKHVQAVWVEGLVTFWEAVASACEGDEQALAGVQAGVRGFVTYSKNMGIERYGAEVRHLMDDYRNGRTESGFTPRGDHILNDGEGR